jgi:alcohol dehydrogenase (cytochrome c)
MVALDMRSGAVVWEHTVASAADPIGFSGGPLIAKGKIIQGMSGCVAPYPGGCYVLALDPETGAEAWRFNTIARPGQPGGDSWNGAPVDQRYGGSVWNAGSYDPALDLLFIGTGQTYKAATLLQNGSGGPGSADALYTDSTLALRPETGELVWYFQHMGQDVWDLDWAFERTLATLTIDGAPRRTLTTAGKLGIFDTLDAATGRYLFSVDVGLQTLVEAIDPLTGAKKVGAAFKPVPDADQTICPSAYGGRDWPATAFNPTSGILFVPLNEACMPYRWFPGGSLDIYGLPMPRPGGDGMIGRVQAIDLAAHKTLWTMRRRAPQSSAILATAGGIVFEGSHDRWFRASDDRTGRTLWQIRLNGAPSAFPITYSVDGVQYVAVSAGAGSHDFLESRMGTLTPEIATPSSGTTLWVFRLPSP